MAGSREVATLDDGRPERERERDDRDERELPASVGRLAAMVKKARERRGWSQIVLAETAHVSHDVITRLEAGKADMPFGVAADVARILNVSLDAAVYGQQTVNRVREAAEEVEHEDS